MMLSEVIYYLETKDKNKICKIGFNNPHSYRGDYEDLAFEEARNISIGEMLEAARSALGKTFQGWKGGDYKMDEYSYCHVVKCEGECGETIGPLLLTFMTESEFDEL